MNKEIKKLIESIRIPHIKENLNILYAKYSPWNEKQLNEIKTYIEFVLNGLLLKEMNGWAKFYKYIKKNECLYNKFWDVLKSKNVYSRAELEEMIHQSFIKEGVNSKFATVGVLRELKSRFWRYNNYYYLKEDERGVLYLETLWTNSPEDLLYYFYINPNKLALEFDSMFFDWIANLK